MKQNNSKLIGWLSAILALVFIAAGLTKPAYCQTNGTALLLQQTPVQGGSITPGIGVHHFESNIEVALTAVPKPGYQFVYWLGDVSDSTASRTTTYLDAPKIIIAVFEQGEYEFLATPERTHSAPIGGMALSVPDYSRQGYSGGGAKRPSKPPLPPSEPPEEEPEPEDFPVPQEGEDFPVSETIPEPATICLLGLGGLILLRKRRREYTPEGKQR